MARVRDADPGYRAAQWLRSVWGVCGECVGSAMLSEERRQAYLKAMGIDVLYPRRSLPGAAPSPAYVFSELETPADRVFPAERPSARTAAARAGLAESAQPAGKGPSPHSQKPGPDKPESARFESGKPQSPIPEAGKPRSPLPESIRSGASEPEGDRPAPARTDEIANTEPTPDGDTAAPSFLLRCYHIDPRLAVLCELPRHAPAQQTRQALKLLQGILRALDVEPRLEAEAGAQLQWPLHEDMTPEQASARHAAQVLDGFIRKQLQQAPAANLLVLGERIAELLPGASVAGEASDYPLRALSIQLTRVNSLGAMLSMPELKPECWRDLQPLRDRLRAASS